MKKRQVVLSLSLLGILSLTACGPSGSSSEQTDSDSSSSGSVNTDSSTSSTQPVGQRLPIAWQSNSTYQRYLSRKSTVNSEFGKGDFISGEGKFRIGTANAVFFAPKVTYMDFITQNPEQEDSFPVGSTIEIYSNPAEGEPTKLETSTYINEEDVTELLETGMLKFKDDIAEDASLDITLVYKAPSSSTNLSPLEYDITIVPGAYNVTEAKELVVYDNCHDDQSYIDMKKAYMGEDATASSSYDDIIIFNDITIGKDDLPSWVMWSKDDPGCNPALYGTLKDWLYLYEKELDSDGGVGQRYAIYGNYNQLTLGQDFPFVISEDSWSSTNANLPDGDATNISAHTALFGNKESYLVEGQLEGTFIIEDLHAYGNQGVATSQIEDYLNTPDNPDDDRIASGILFYKNTSKVEMNNCSIQHYFTILVNNGEGEVSGLKKLHMRPTVTYNDCRMSDCFSSMLFNYADTVININRSVVENAGGFLVINQAIPTQAGAIDPSSKWAGLLEGDNMDLVKGSDVIIDSETKLQNWVTGKGGWFDSYGLGDLFQTRIKPLVSDPLNQSAGKTLFKEVNGDQRINAIGLMMNCDLHTAAELDPGMKGVMKIGDIEYVNPEQGKEEFTQTLTALMANPKDQAAQLAFASTLTTTNYGANFMQKYITAGLMANNGTDGNYYVSPYTTDGTRYTAMPLQAIVNGALGVQADQTIDREKFAGDYVTMAYDYGATPNPNINLQQVLADAMAYKGSTMFQVIFGLNDFE